MADERLRELERRWKESGSLEDKGIYFRERDRLRLMSVLPKTVYVMKSKDPDNVKSLGAYVIFYPPNENGEVLHTSGHSEILGYHTDGNMVGNYIAKHLARPLETVLEDEYGKRYFCFWKPSDWPEPTPALGGGFWNCYPLNDQEIENIVGWTNLALNHPNERYDPHNPSLPELSFTKEQVSRLLL